MFTAKQIKEAHGKVRTGADFPSFIKEIKSMGVNYYETFVKDGHTDYFGANDHQVSTAAKFQTLAISEEANTNAFVSNLKAHQQGNTDYMTFCRDCAQSGIEKWAVCTDTMTCTYFDRSGIKVLTEDIPHI